MLVQERDKPLSIMSEYQEVSDVIDELVSVFNLVLKIKFGYFCCFVFYVSDVHTV